MTSLQVLLHCLPFKHKFEIRDALIADLRKAIINDKYLQQSEIEEKIDALCKWICTTPKKSFYRLDRFKDDYTNDLDDLHKALKQDGKPDPSIHFLPDLPNGIVAVDSWDLSVSLDLKICPDEIIVDAICGAVVLRGSHVFAPGVIGMPNGLSINAKVSVFADVTGQCKKGLIKPYANSNKIYLGNGILRQTRKELFCKAAKNPRGIAIIMTDVISRVPQLNVNNVSLRSHALLQNLPSIVCSLILNPQPGETILDMCAAPGNKTTHISLLMKGQGTIIALEKNLGKVKRFEKKCNNVKNIKIFCCDATKAVIEREHNFVHTDGPPFEENYFDRILLDTPCSALGQRPQLYNTITSAQLYSYVPLQRNLFSTAVRLLKQNGTLVYSTCTITIAENEGIIAWALKQFPKLQLQSVKNQINTDKYGTQGYIIDGLTSENAEKVCRFGPESDSVGFFIACLKKCSY
ncbi:PREDICTED: putative methyltransferase NSUN6 [Cyphomyrmex costatus]|uniref:Putative methyltransferase NSUN6 n=1 Tax=Cyphomyrmex costatus TaxID=456900 RepID=A0A151I7G5_9HYME|nr:PREDICTED: putative methyltransferase NSUN6 [Cyphomyrmex costatus]XP_018405201.1 PREDICTED: putative methyltransferase NSUN6 [Cyphomyrmex costatus]XP_018405202.1 PREDICTED: putative methyltransferase NSUN6 [Cyphomyrmex costatus]KYM94030.1 Putative methyltransferase NSUN6 [Cyphomyrmex costatus]